MENYSSYTHSGVIKYDLNLSLHTHVLDITLTVIEDRAVRKFTESLINRSLLADLKKEFKTVEKLFIFMKKKNNFLVNPAKGQILLLQRKVDGQKMLEK